MSQFPFQITKHARSEKITQSQLKAYLCIIAAQTLWAGSGIVGRISTAIPVNPLVLQFYKLLLSTPIFYIIASWEGNAVLNISAKNLIPMLVTSLLICGSNICFRVAQSIATASASAGWQPTQQIVTFLLGLLLGLETLSTRTALGVALGFIGACTLVVLDPRVQVGTTTNESSDALLGHLILLMNVLFASSYIVSRQRIVRMCKELSPQQVLFWTTFMGVGISFLIATVVEHWFPGLSFFLCKERASEDGQWKLPTEVIGITLFYVLIPTVACHSLIGVASPHLPPSTFGVFANLQPVLTGIFEFVSVGLFHWNPSGKLAMPGQNMLAVFPIMCGMCLVISAPKVTHVSGPARGNLLEKKST